MPKLKVMTIVGTRPEIIRLSRVISVLDEFCDQSLVHTGQNYDYELNEIFFEQLKIREPDVFLNAAAPTAAETIGQVIIAADAAMRSEKPDAVLVLGDTNSCLAAISAKRLKIPVFHMEAGNRCFDFRVPEEINRRIIDHTADINLTYSDIARDYLLREGLSPDRVIRIGSPMREVLDFYRDDIAASAIIRDLDLAHHKFFLLSMHREENVDTPENNHRMFDIIDALAKRYDLPVIVSTHPRTRARLEKINRKLNPKVRFLKPFGFLDYVKLQLSAKAVLSDSGTITEESSILNFPALNLREVHERPEGVEEGAVMFVGLDIERIMQGLSILEHQSRDQARDLKLVRDYEPDNVSKKMLRIIVSYTDFVNREVWRKTK
ncbi:MAG: UDP-N-acetylglucosamine 2-epimerase (non-hydrolyzing) [Parvibaculaceae bacterium]|nr:UDP-N-acetylglucosamine 2-epimerase (non-hydrolyzing) [Parvibaculaceae bacterium]